MSTHCLTTPLIVSSNQLNHMQPQTCLAMLEFNVLTFALSLRQLHEGWLLVAVCSRPRLTDSIILYYRLHPDKHCANHR